MSKKALFVWGGWDGHTPKQSAETFVPLLEAEGYAVTVSNSMDPYKDAALMRSIDLIVPIWTMGQIEPEQERGLPEAVHGRAAGAGCHGGTDDAVRNSS